ncbi:ribokinase [Halobacillus shinanisalinarum]|uniref:Ribokinase n=1 Tax=Halobacillus shinanisalinarum TaxID=2932258 RepID=A0ABY4H6Q6_9BACI|nr:ribokinase [Halobacillus shinanisalinarum]UOQ94672.1 ribokinase [Halobacillus shinanisalinarum]
MKEPNILVVGSLNMDIVIEADRAPLAGETIMGQHSSFIPGGKGANQAVALAKLGAQTTLLGAVGNDPFGTSLLRSLKDNGVETGQIKKVDHAPTGIASILLAEGDNRIVVVPGANDDCLPEDIREHEDLIEKADLVLLQLEIPLDTVITTAKIAKKFGKTVILNPAPARSLPEELLQNVDYITPNHSELGILSKMDQEGFDLNRAMEILQRSGVDNVITTLGSEGATYKSQESAVKTAPAYQVPVVDTTGAGDAFNAGLSYAIGMDKDISEAVSFASKVSALSVTKFGAQAGMPDRKAVEAFDTPPLNKDGN